jgi:hypothetical protein
MRVREQYIDTKYCNTIGIVYSIVGVLWVTKNYCNSIVDHVVNNTPIAIYKWTSLQGETFITFINIASLSIINI